jgi:hypothetical protein
VRRLLLPALLASATALADQNDFRIYQLGNPSTAMGATGATSNANGNFRVFARQFAAVMTSATLMPPETLGTSGFAFTAEASYVQIAPSNNIGALDPATSMPKPLPTLPTEKAFQGGWLLIPGVHVRKGLPYSFELGGRMSWIQDSRMFVGMIELKWALNEGFTYLPDIAVGGRIAKLINSRDFDLTTGGLDVSIGKQFALGGMLTLTPYVGWDLMFVGASTNPVDFNPKRSLASAELPANQFQDIYVFDSLQSAQNTHNRFYGGLRFISKPFMLGIEASYTIIGAFQDATTGMNRQVPAVLAFNFSAGVDL